MYYRTGLFSFIDRVVNAEIKSDKLAIFEFSFVRALVVNSRIYYKFLSYFGYYRYFSIQFIIFFVFLFIKSKTHLLQKNKTKFITKFPGIKSKLQ